VRRERNEERLSLHEYFLRALKRVVMSANYLLDLIAEAPDGGNCETICPVAALTHPRQGIRRTIIVAREPEALVH
jgi:hypothetical protein